MAKLLDTTADFEKFARKAGLEAPFIRQQLWKQMYEAVHPDVFDAFNSKFGSVEGMHAMTGQLSKVRKRIKEAGPQMEGLIDEVEPALQEVMGIQSGAHGGASVLHVLMVGTFSTSAFVAPIRDEIAVFHCLEWFSTPETAKVLIAHETSHAWHQILMQQQAPEDLAWTAFYEGLAIQASREVAPDRPANDYFWFGVAGFEDWIEACEKDEAKLMKQFKNSLKSKDGADLFFGSGFVEAKWRTGYWIADKLVRRLGSSTKDLARLPIEQARESVVEALK